MIPPLALAPPFFLLGHLAYTDAKTQRLPNRMVGLLALMAVVYVAVLPALTWRPALLGCLLGAGIPFAMNAFGAVLGRKEGFGMGDVKLLGALGLLIGPNVVLVLGLACVMGAAYALWKRRLSERKTPSCSQRDETFAFGPSIAWATAVVVLLSC